MIRRFTEWEESKSGQVGYIRSDGIWPIFVLKPGGYDPEFLSAPSAPTLGFKFMVPSVWVGVWFYLPLWLYNVLSKLRRDK